MCNIFQWTRLSVLRTIGEPTLETTEATVGYAVWWVPRQLWALGPPRNQRNDTLTAIVLAVGGALLKQTVCACSCVSSVTVRQRRCRPTEPTRTRRVRLRVGLNTHSHSSLFFFPALPSSSLSFLSEPLKCQKCLPYCVQVLTLFVFSKFPKENTRNFVLYIDHVSHLKLEKQKYFIF